MKPEDIKKMIDERVRQEVGRQIDARFDIYGGEVPRAGLVFPLDDDTIKSLKQGGFILSGAVALSSGVATVTDSRIRAASGTGTSFVGSIALVAYLTPAGTTGTNLKAVCTENTLTITAIDTAGATVASDTSTIQYLILF